MCTTFFYFPADPSTAPLLIAFNRDENILRPTEPLGFWSDDPNVLSGRDFSLQGTWLGLNVRTQNIAFLTNLIDLATLALPPNPALLSRGEVTRKFLQTAFFDHHSLPSFLAELARLAPKFNPFNLVVGNYALNRYFYFGSADRTFFELPKNTLLGFSNNAAFREHWEHVDRGVLAFQAAGSYDADHLDGFLQVMRDSREFQVPGTPYKCGIYREPRFIPQKLLVTGTVSTSFVFIRQGRGVFAELRARFDWLEKVRRFMLGRKTAVRLKNFILFVLFLGRQNGFEAQCVTKTIPFTFDN